ncbi:hypothetical protein SAMN06295905_3018 [Devosia lucknowensis]|uniref:Uncharacterized protein n=1 Tax=Devosia lucknowensis TaxID=1096929 RepID=A0A1Y6GAI5_9HYPH|nr:hypothetical protein [Devosia lucknowensis]SMQ85728.1 hypothetical protein SAMN06295905_3018 [Devosia lucknowensis]
MRRLIAAIAVLFTFASVMGATVAHAHRYVSTPIVVLNHVDADNQSIPIVVQIQRGQIDLGAGIVMPCGPHHAIGVAIPALPPAPDCASPEARTEPIGASRPARQLLRPPISA